MADDEVSSDPRPARFFFFQNPNLSVFRVCPPQAKKAKQAEIDRKRAEVRKRMEEASKAKKAKKGFMTPDRKKKLRVSIYLRLYKYNILLCAIGGCGCEYCS